MISPRNPSVLGCVTICISLAFLLSGCGPAPTPTGTVHGKVLLDGSAYGGVSIVFLDLKTGQGSNVNVQDDGTFALPVPIPVGTYTVYLAPKEVPETQATGDQPQKEEAVTIDESIPDKYWNEATSEIKVEIKEGDNTPTIKLTKAE